MKKLILFMMIFMACLQAETINWVKSGLMSKNALSDRNEVINDVLHLNAYSALQRINIETGNLDEIYENDSYVTSFIKDDTLIYLNRHYSHSSINLIDDATKEIFYSDTIKINEQRVRFISVSDVNQDKSLLVVLGYTGNSGANYKHYLVFWDINKKRTRFIYELEEYKINDIKFLNDSSLVVSNVFLEFYEIENNTLVYKGNDSGYFDSELLLVNHNSNQLYVAYDHHEQNYLNVYDLSNFQLIKQTPVHIDFVLPGYQKNSENIAYTDTTGSVVIYNVKNDNKISEFSTGYIPTSYLFYQSDYIIVFSTVEGRVDLYNYKTKEYIRSLVFAPSNTTNMILSDNEKSLVTVCTISEYESERINVINLDSNKIINSIQPVSFNSHNIEMDISNFSEKVVLTDLLKAYFWDYKTDEIWYFMPESGVVADICCNPVKDEFLVSSNEGEIYVFDTSLNQVNIFTVDSDYKVISAMYNQSGDKIYAFLSDEEELFCFPYEINITTNEQILHSNIEILIDKYNGDILSSKYFDRYYGNKSMIYDLNNNEIIILPNEYCQVEYPASSSIYPRSTTISESADYVLYIHSVLGVGLADLFKIKDSYNKVENSSYTLNHNEFLDGINKSISSYYNMFHPSSALIRNNNEIIMDLHNGLLVSIDLQDTLNTSFREVSQNGEALINEFYNFNDVLTIEVNPYINRKIYYQITDISGNTIQKGTLPRGTSHEQINFFGYPKSSYFIMFHTETSKQIFKFIN